MSLFFHYFGIGRWRVKVWLFSNEKIMKRDRLPWQRPPLSLHEPVMMIMMMMVMMITISRCNFLLQMMEYNLIRK